MSERDVKQYRRDCERAEAEVRSLAQAMWDALAVLGFDNDGDKTPAALIAGMGVGGFARAFLRDMGQQREDYDEALDEITAAEAKLAAVEKVRVEMRAVGDEQDGPGVGMVVHFSGRLWEALRTTPADPA